MLMEVPSAQPTKKSTQDILSPFESMELLPQFHLDGVDGLESFDLSLYLVPQRVNVPQDQAKDLQEQLQRDFSCDDPFSSGSSESSFGSAHDDMDNIDTLVDMAAHGPQHDHGVYDMMEVPRTPEIEDNVIDFTNDHQSEDRSSLNSLDIKAALASHSACKPETLHLQTTRSQDEKCNKEIATAATTGKSKRKAAKSKKSSRRSTSYKDSNGVRHYPCQFCSKAFTDRSNLRRHRRTHTGEKPFTCEYCDKPFNHSSNRNKHQLACPAAPHAHPQVPENLNAL